ncbi:hypothetical protein [Streptomyces sp. NBC_01343]|uniref:hypothetical protein n=1 Tax=Streptomyces sp. NBC_01343 TaxID=2903832 RepID=UPI002E10A730
MRRGSRTKTGAGGADRAACARRWSAPAVAGADGGAAALGSGGLYAAGLLLAGEEIASGTKVRGIDIGGRTGQEVREGTVTFEKGKAKPVPPVTRPVETKLRLDGSGRVTIAEEVRAPQGPRTHVKQPATRTDTGPECEPQSPLEGFGVAVDRVFVQGGQEVKRETMKTRYTPRDSVTCG